MHTRKMLWAQQEPEISEANMGNGKFIRIVSALFADIDGRCATDIELSDRPPSGS